jgi:hypothetical protein
MYIPSETSPERMYRSFQYHGESGLSKTENMQRALAQVPFIDEPADRVMVVACSPTAEVPLGDFYPEDAEAVYRYSYPDLPDSQVLFNRLPTVGLAELFSIDTGLYELLLERFPKASYYAMQSSVLERFWRRSRLGEHKKVYVYLHDKQISIYHFDDGKLMFANSFFAVDLDDMQYYVLSVWQHFGLDQEHDELLVYGNAVHKSRLIAGMQRYLRNVFSIIPSAVFNRAPLARIETIPFDLLALLV